MKVELVTKTQGIGKYQSLNNEEVIAAIARHGAIKKDSGKLVKYLMNHSHWSPLDMINFGFEIQTSRAIGRQMLRHSSLKPQEISQRYSDNISFEHIELRREHKTNRQSSEEVFDPMIETWSYHSDSSISYEANLHIEELMLEINLLYEKLMRAGVAKECARMILPECTSTILTFNGSLRGWLSFLNVRCAKETQKELVEIATAIGEVLEKELPNIFSVINWRNGYFM